MRFQLLLCVLLCVYACLDVQAGDRRMPRDTVPFYENLENYSQRSVFTSFLFRTFFHPVIEDITTQSPRYTRQYYAPFEGKTIRHIHVVTLDPFGSVLGDTVSVPAGFLPRMGNTLHLKTRDHVIENLLLFSQNEPFDSLLVMESERLVRSRAFVSEVVVWAQEVPGNETLVDVYVYSIDSWSIIPGGYITDSKLVAHIREDNVLGLGHEFRYGLVWKHDNGDYAYHTRFLIPNIYNTYISSVFNYGADEYGNSEKGIAFNRPFFSPVSRWAGGVDISQHARLDSLGPGYPINYKYNQQDYWLATAFSLLGSESEYTRFTRLITGMRYLHVNYLDRPLPEIDTLAYFTNEQFYMASLGVSSRQYVQDAYVFHFGRVEDVAVGRVLSATGGYQQKNQNHRKYFGMQMSSGNYYSWGYLATHLEYGTFLHNKRLQDGVFQASTEYFTGLRETGRWKFRQFVRTQLTLGYNRTDYDTLTLNDRYGLRGFRSPVLSGTNRMLLTLQTQSYAPWNVAGFRFGPYMICSLGMLSDAGKGFGNSKLYSQLGLGVLIKNDYLVRNAIQISVAFYPRIPGKGENIFLWNPYQTTDFGLREFEMGKPDRIVYE